VSAREQLGDPRDANAVCVALLLPDVGSHRPEQLGERQRGSRANAVSSSAPSASSRLR
jgi:hypothetical protein